MSNSEAPTWNIDQTFQNLNELNGSSINPVQVLRSPANNIAIYPLALNPLDVHAHYFSDPEKEPKYVKKAIDKVLTNRLAKRSGRRSILALETAYRRYLKLGENVRFSVPPEERPDLDFQISINPDEGKFLPAERTVELCPWIDFLTTARYGTHKNFPISQLFIINTTREGDIYRVNINTPSLDQEKALKKLTVDYDFFDLNYSTLKENFRLLPNGQILIQSLLDARVS